MLQRTYQKRKEKEAFAHPEYFTMAQTAVSQLVALRALREVVRNQRDLVRAMEESPEFSSPALGKQFIMNEKIRLFRLELEKREGELLMCERQTKKAWQALHDYRVRHNIQYHPLNYPTDLSILTK